MERTRLRATFDEVAELYDRARPGYPRAVLDDLVALARLAADARIVEIGPGTGQATVALAERGLHVTAVELGESLAAVAERKLTSFDHVEIVRADFESWEPPRRDFDAVVAFTAFHWLDPGTRVERCARLLRPCGSLAVVQTQHVNPEGDDPFFAEVQDAYVRAGEPRAAPIRPDDVADLTPELVAGAWFEQPEVRRYVWQEEYDADSYAAVPRHVLGPPLDAARRAPRALPRDPRANRRAADPQGVPRDPPRRAAPRLTRSPLAP
jgi:SAM-dependent methyltransferase